MYRTIDELGRFVIPKEMRNTLNINAGDELKITVVENKIILEKENTINLREYIKSKQHEDISVETYRVLEDILDKLG